MPFLLFLKNMTPKKKWAILSVLLFTAVFIHLFSSNTSLVETYYSTGVYPYLSVILKYGFGWLPFSLGDLLYWIVIVMAFIKLARFIQLLYKKNMTVDKLKELVFKSATLLLALYISFNLLWGINYNRKGIASQLGIKLEKYSAQELVTVDSILLQKVNESKLAVLRKGNSFNSTREMLVQSNIAYQQVAVTYPFLQYKPVSIKPSMWGWLGNYLGFTGYYNPFTGEAQLNTTVPAFLQPYTSCHEMAHQLGYAKENEANFTGYLAAASSPDTLFHYSVYLDLFLYAQRNLYDADSAAAKLLARKLLPEVKADLKEWKDFNNRHRSPLEPVFKWLYGKYLKQNQQPAGLLSYDEVTGFLIAYYKKFGRL
jgi:Protein of unknown function (DUF3810)